MMRVKKFPKESFIAGFYISNQLCDDMISFFKSQKNYQAQGEIGVNQVDKKVKDSIDLSCDPSNPNYPISEYYSNINKYMLKYQDMYPELKKHYSFNLCKPFNIQYYKKEGGFKIWHSERMSPLVTNRILVFMTYLNNVPDGGTEFKYQKIKVKAEKGLTLFWPTDFTHTHKGQISKKYEKYIATGWIDYYELKPQ